MLGGGGVKMSLGFVLACSISLFRVKVGTSCSAVILKLAAVATRSYQECGCPSNT